MLLTAVLSARPREILEIGCGTGQFAKAVMEAMPECVYLATDQSEAMVAETKRLGVATRQADAMQLLFMAETFDGVVAAWMLYHVPDLDRQPGDAPGPSARGQLAVATNGEPSGRAPARGRRRAPPHAVLLRERRGGAATSLPARDPARHRDSRDLPDHALAVAYLGTFSEELAAGLPWFDGPRSTRASRPSSPHADGLSATYKAPQRLWP